MIDGNKIYYCYNETNKPNIINIRCINKNIKKGKKATSKQLTTINIKSEDEYDYGWSRARLENGNLYVLQSDRINTYSLKGKKTGQYSIPKGNTTLYTEVPDHDSMNNEDTISAGMTIHSFCVRNDELFYCNRNGVYRLSKNKKPKLIYNAKNDIYFGSDYGVADICVGDKNTFCIMFDHISNYDVCVYNWAYKLVKYSKK